MKNVSRRNFLRNTSLAATGVCLVSPLGARNKSIRNGTAIGCAPNSIKSLTGTIASAQSGNWSDPATWGGRLPQTSDTPLISAGHSVNFDVNDFTASGLNVSSGSTLTFDQTKSTILRSSANIVVEGTLVMKPNSYNVSQTIEFIGIDENRYVGGAGMNVVASDVGLWVMNSGKLDLQGSTKTAWLNASSDLRKGDTVLQTATSPNGWQIGDEVAITPTMFKDLVFDRRKIVAISGNSVTLDSPLSADKLKIDGTWTAEIMNLSRNVGIQGTKSGAAHVVIMSNVPQSVKHVELKYLGPRKDINGDNITEFVRGRYALHFHHAADGSRGSIVEACSVHDVYSHSYVFHSSHGITFKNCVAFDVTEVPYWADSGHAMHDTLLDTCIAAKVNFVFGSLNMNEEFEPDATKSRNANSSGFKLGLGDGNACVNCVAVGTYGDPEGSGGFDWEADNDGAWKFVDCLAHNNETGLFVWQATSLLHVIENFKAYSNFGHGIYHGSYANVYRYFDGRLFESTLNAKANSSDKRRFRLENIDVNVNGKKPYAVIAQGAQVSGGIPVLLRNINMRGWTKAPLLLDSSFREDGLSNGTPLLKHLDLVHCDLGGGNPEVSAITHPGEVIRVQPKPGQGECYQLTQTASGTPVREVIGRFAPDIWGNGRGLIGEYYQGNDFTNLAFKRIDPLLDFSEWYDSGVDKMKVDHKIGQNKGFSVKWTGHVEAQFTEEYEFTVVSSGKAVIIFNGARYSQVSSFKVNLTAGEKYSIEILWSNSNTTMAAYGFCGLSLMWNSNSLSKFIKGGEPIPMSQLYPGNVVITPQTPTTGLTAAAGADIAITLPVDHVVLDGSTSSPIDTINTFEWSRVSGPVEHSITSKNNVKTEIKGLVAGTYVFRLKATDNNGLTATDDVTVTVNAAGQNDDKNNNKTEPVVANAGPDITITLPVTIAVLNGSASSPASSIKGYEWSKLSGPSGGNIETKNGAETNVKALAEGTYTFRLQVTDLSGNVTNDDVQIIVKPQPPVANAGDDATITLPTNSIVLNGSRSTAASGIRSYEWSKVSGPARSRILNNGAISPVVKDLEAGTYTFQLLITDKKGNTATDQVLVTVKTASGRTEQRETRTEGNQEKENRREETGLTLQLKASPNPSVQSVNTVLEVSGNSNDPISVGVYNRWGKLVANYPNIRTNATIRWGASSEPGTYFAVAQQGGLKKTITLIKL